MSFLPKGYEVPTESNYFKLQNGENKFRILDSAIIGQVFWIETKEGRRPIRKHQDEKISAGELDADSDIRHFWAFPVYNIKDKKIQIMEITQKTIMNAINALVKSNDWGDPKEYDLNVTREGEGKQTEYHVMPSPKKPLDPGVIQLYKDMNIRIEKLYSADDPFEATENVTKQETIVDIDEIEKVLGV
jgi:hypothetical protein